MRVSKRIAVPVIALVLMLALMVCVNAAAGSVSIGENAYAGLGEAVAAAQPGSILQLNGDITENLTISKDLTLDLNGFKVSGTVTVAQGYTLEVKDSTTDDFTAATYGSIKTVGNARAAEGYLAIPEENGTSYHRLDLQISSVNLRPGTVGIYYGSNFGGDEAVKAHVECYGTALSLTGAPTAQEIAADKYYSRHTAFSSDSWVCGQTGKAYGTLLKGIWKETNSPQKNAQNAERKIYSASYVQLTDGTILLGNSVSMSLRDIVEEIDTRWDALNAGQITGMKEMYKAYDNHMESWNIPNLRRSINCQIYIDYTANGDGTVTAKFSADGRVKLAMLELQLEMQLTNATYGDCEILASGSAEANCVDNKFYFSLMSVEDLDIKEMTELFRITFKNTDAGTKIGFRLTDSAVSDGAFTNVENVSLFSAEYSG